MNGLKSALGFAVLEGANFLNNDVKNLLSKSGFKHLNNWEVNLHYHFGGYAKINEELIKFIKGFEEKTGITIEPIYTGKMLCGIYNLVAKNDIKQGLTIVAVHTGGLQGLEGLKQRQKNQ